MKIFLVGGAVRDLLMGLTPKDKDYVVLGSSIEEMQSLGFEMVGEHFPVFLHPQTREEYALARKEKKTGKGTSAFSFETENVSLYDDLFRRDLTINAIALDERTNQFFDPFGGQDDIKNKVLKHVSTFFSEDPLRVLRVARFQARYSDFTIHPDTKVMMTKLMEDEAKYLTKERVYAEFNKAFKELSDHLFFQVLNEVGFFKHYLNIDSIELHFNWKQLNQNQKWAYLCTKYPKFKTLPLKNEESALVEKNLAFNASLTIEFKNVWNYIQQLRLKSDKNEQLLALLTPEQIQFFSFLTKVVDSYNKNDLTSLSSLTAKELGVKLNELKYSSFNEALNGIDK
jgi:tRNA nucleotidyltransferase/poly(A) polymerase